MVYKSPSKDSTCSQEMFAMLEEPAKWLDPLSSAFIKQSFEELMNEITKGFLNLTKTLGGAPWRLGE